MSTTDSAGWNLWPSNQKEWNAYARKVAEEGQQFTRCPVCEATIPLTAPQGLCEAHRYDDGPQGPQEEPMSPEAEEALF